jgi:hypothetical protein
MGPNFDPQKCFHLRTFSKALDRIFAPENLRTIASTLSDPETVLGLACLAGSRSPVRQELLETAVRGTQKYRSVGAVLRLILDGIDPNAVMELIRVDPDNALGYYLHGYLLYDGDRDDEALEAFRKGAHCSELRLYEPVTGEAIFKALDALNVQGRDRLCALSWMACRWSNFNGGVMQFLSTPLSDWSRCPEIAARHELSELLLVLGGHLFATNFYNRWAARQALDHAIFGLNAAVPAAEKFPATAGGSARQGLIGTMLRWPGPNVSEDPGEPHKRLRLAQFLPDRIHRAFAAADPEEIRYLGESHLKVSDERKAALERARAKFIESGKVLIETVLTDTDRIMAPYLKGIPLMKRDADGRQVVPFETDVEKLLGARPEVFAAAAASEEAMRALWDNGAGDPSNRNIGRMMEINCAMYSYAVVHGDTYPASTDVLFEEGYLKPAVKLTSVLTGKPYVYAAAGEKMPLKMKDRWRWVVLYDDNPDQWGYYQCVFASWTGAGMPVDEVKEQLRARKKLRREAARH